MSSSNTSIWLDSDKHLCRPRFSTYSYLASKINRQLYIDNPSRHTRTRLVVRKDSSLFQPHSTAQITHMHRHNYTVTSLRSA
jgi:hypothetical protein